MFSGMQKYSILTTLIFAVSAAFGAARDVICLVGVRGVQDTVLEARAGDTLDVWTQSTQGSVWHVSRDSGATWTEWDFVAGATNHRRFFVRDSLAGKVIAFMVRGSPYADSYSGLVAIAPKPPKVVNVRPRGAKAPLGSAARFRDAAGRTAHEKSFYTFRSEWKSQPYR